MSTRVAIAGRSRRLRRDGRGPCCAMPENVAGSKITAVRVRGFTCAAVGLCVLASMACTKTPTAPEPPGGPVVSSATLLLLAPSAILHDGPPVQATAHVEVGDGSRVDIKDLKCQPRWSSSAPAIAQVDADGRIQPISAGEVTITAACGLLRADAVVRIRQAIRVAGRVIEALDPKTGVPDVTVTVTGGDSDGVVAVTDREGRFLLDRLWEPDIAVRVSASNIEPQTTRISQSDSGVSIRVAPRLLDRTLVVAAADRGETWLFDFETHLTGPITVTLQSDCFVNRPSWTWQLLNSVEIAPASNPVVWVGLGNGDQQFESLKFITATKIRGRGRYPHSVRGSAHCRWIASLRYPS